MSEIIIIFGIITAVSVFYAVRTRQHEKKQISELLGILTEIKNGNGNRRVLAKAGELMAPIAYEINNIVISYEDKLTAYRKTDEANKQLMTNLSHDVRTPLTTLIGYLDAVRKSTVKGNEREKYIETARKKAYDLKEYIDILFEWFKLNSNEINLNIETIEAAELTRNILIDWIPIFEDNGINYIIDIPDKPVSAKLDINGYTRILNNLIQNIISHSGADEIEISLSHQNDDIKISVSDNGNGIDKDDLTHIFDRLYKCDKGRSEKGSGLGLSIVRQLTEKMNGSIAVESSIGAGTTFTLLFPVQEQR